MSDKEATNLDVLMKNFGLTKDNILQADVVGDEYVLLAAKRIGSMCLNKKWCEEKYKKRSNDA